MGELRVFFFFTHFFLSLKFNLRKDSEKDKKSIKVKVMLLGFFSDSQIRWMYFTHSLYIIIYHMIHILIFSFSPQNLI